MGGNKKNMIYGVTIFAVLVIYGVLLVCPHMITWPMSKSRPISAALHTAGKSMATWLKPFIPASYEKSVTRGTRAATAGPGSDHEMKNPVPSAATKLNNSPAAGLRTESETDLTAGAAPAETKSMTMGEQIRSNLGLNPTQNPLTPANPLPTDAEITAGVGTQNRQKDILDDKLAKRDTIADKITDGVRGLPSEILFPKVDPKTVDQPHVSNPLPADIIHAVKSRKYIAHW